MPYRTLAELPDAVKKLPKAAQEIFRAAFNSAYKEYGSEEKAFAVAWAAVKRKYRKEGDRWVAIEAVRGGENVGNLLEATKREADYDWPASAFLVVPDPDKPSTWKLRIKELVNGRPEVTQAQLGRAAAALSPGGFRGQQVDLTPEQRRAAIRKLRSLYRQHGWEPPESLKEAVGYSQIRDALYAALDTAPNGERQWRWSVQEIYPGYAIVEDNKASQLYRVDYVVTDRDEVQIGTKTKVRVEYVPIQESIYRLTEAVQADEAGKIWRVTLIRPGWSENGKYYSREVLAAATSLYEGARAFADHPSQQELRDRPERSVRDVVGWYEGVRQEPDGRLTADLHLLESAAWLGAILKEKPDLLGLSHHALGRTRIGTAEGRTGRIVESIAKVVSVDIVTEAAAGGSVEHMIASNREGDEDMDWENVTLEALKEARPDLVEAILAQAKNGAETVLSELKEAVKKTEQENVQLREAVARFEARAIIAEKVAASNLPAPAQARVRQVLEASVPLKDGALDTQVLETRIAEAIKAEQDYLAQVAGNPVRGAGAAGGASNLEEALKKAESAMDRLFGIKTGGEK